jgi:hypothetical protein
MSTATSKQGGVAWKSKAGDVSHYACFVWFWSHVFPEDDGDVVYRPLHSESEDAEGKSILLSLKYNMTIGKRLSDDISIKL